MIVMRGLSSTAAEEARLFYQKVKVYRAHLLAAGYPYEDSYMILLNVLLRLAYEERNEQGIETLRAILHDKPIRVDACLVLAEAEDEAGLLR